MDDQLITDASVKNPVTGTLGDYGAPAKEKEALTLEQQEKLLKFVEQSNVYKPHLPMMQVSEVFP